MEQLKILKLQKKENNKYYLNIRMFKKIYYIKFICDDFKPTQHNLFNITLLVAGTKSNIARVKELQLFRVEKDLTFLKNFKLIDNVRKETNKNSDLINKNKVIDAIESIVNDDNLKGLLFNKINNL